MAVRLVTINKKICADCGADVEKIGARGMLRCGPCGARYRAAVTQRRHEGRLMVNKKGKIKYKGMGTPLTVLVEDVSFHGARIRYTGDTSLFYNRKNHGYSILMVNVGELKLHSFAKVVWTSPVSNKESRAGLRFIWHS